LEAISTGPSFHFAKTVSKAKRLCVYRMLEASDAEIALREADLRLEGKKQMRHSKP
jgi:hypothetical protein